MNDDKIRKGMGARENMGREMYRRRGRKLPGIRVLKGRKAGEIRVYRVYKVHMRIQGIQGIQGIYGYTGYTGYTGVYRVYRVYMGIQGIQGIQNTEIFGWYFYPIQTL